MEDEKRDVTVGGENPTTGTQTENNKQEDSKVLSFD